MEDRLDLRLAAAGINATPPARQQPRGTQLPPTESSTEPPTGQTTKAPKDPCKRIKCSEAPKFSGDRVKTPVEEFILEFMEYCSLIGLHRDKYIFTALNVSLTGNVIIW